MTSVLAGSWRRLHFAAVALAVVAVCFASGTAQAQLSPREIRAAAVTTATPRPPSPAPAQQLPKVAGPVFPTGGAGLCQCISDRTRRNTSCLGGAAACQSVCGTTNYSLVPDAAFSCPLAAGEQPERLTQ